jgi:hypothetical protein
MTRFSTLTLTAVLLLGIPSFADEASDQALASLRKQADEAAAAFEKVNDYTCTLLKQERIHGKLLPEQTAQMFVSEKPLFSVLLKFTAPQHLHGQEVCYVAGKNNGQMRVKGSGLKGAVGFVSVNVNDARVMAQSRHTINEGGLGNLIHNLGKTLADEPQAFAGVEMANVEWKERKCVRYEIRHTDKGKSPFARTVVYIDEELKLPVRVENYDAPRDGETVGELMESYSFVNLKLNVGLGAETFKK